MKKTIMLTMIMALGITASAMAAPSDNVEKEVPLANVTMERLHATPWHELGYIEADFDNDPMYQGGDNSDDSSSDGCSCGE